MSGTPADAILPDDPNHRHHPLYRHLLQGVTTAQPGSSPEQRANLAAGLTDAYLRSLPDADRGLRLDETTIRGLNVVAGNPDAQTPSLFAVAGRPGEGAPLISTPLATADVAASQTLATHAQRRTIGADGYLTDPGITRTPIPALEHGQLRDVNAIVLHRTESSTAKSTLNHWQGSSNPYGTHFLIDKDGTIHQTASLNHYTNHIGKIRSKAEEEGTASEQELEKLKEYGVAQTNTYERAKAYPDRFPTSLDSVGIEVVGRYDKASGTWDAPTAQQTEALNRLVGTLKNEYGLNGRDIHEHDKIGYKTQGEGDGLVEPNAHDRDPDLVQRSGPTR